MTQPVRFTSTKWETRTVPLIAEPDFEDLSEALTAEERAEEVRARDEAQETYERFRPITLEVKRVSRTTRQKWDRTFARILADDEVSRHEAKGQSGALHVDTIEKLQAYNEDVVKTALVRVQGLIVGDVDISEVSPSEALEALSDCNLTGYACKAIRKCQSPTVKQGEA